MEAPIFRQFCVIDVWESCRNEVIFKNLEVHEIVYMKSPTYINRKGERSSSSKHQTTKVTKKSPTPKMFKMFRIACSAYLHGLKVLC